MVCTEVFLRHAPAKTWEEERLIPCTPGFPSQLFAEYWHFKVQKHVLQQGKRQQFGVTGFWERWGAEFPALFERWALSCMGRTLGVASADLQGVVWVVWVLVHPFMFGHCYCPALAPEHAQFCAVSFKDAFPLESPTCSSQFAPEHQPPGSFCYIWSVWDRGRDAFGILMSMMHPPFPVTEYSLICFMQMRGVGTLGPFLENSLAWSPQAWILFMLTIKCKIKLFRQS